MFSRKMDPVALSIAEILDKNKEVREQTAKLNREFRVERESQVNPFDRSAYDSRLQEINESIDSNVKPKKSPLTENILKRLADLYLDEDMKSFDDLARTVELDEAQESQLPNPQAQHVLRAGDKVIHGYRERKWPAEFLGYSHKDEESPKYAHMDDVPRGIFPEKALAHYRDLENNDTYASYFSNDKWRIGSSSDVAKITHHKKSIKEDRLDEVGDTIRGRRALADVLGRAVSRLNDPEERTKLRKSNKTDKTINAKYNARMRLVHGSGLYDYGHLKKDAEGKPRISPYKRPKKYNDWKAWATGRKPHGWFEEELSAEKDSKTLDEGHGMFRANTYGKNNEAENDGKKYKIVRFYKNGGRKTISKDVSLSYAKSHCAHPETSSRTCTSKTARAHTRKHGDWFDGYGT